MVHDLGALAGKDLLNALFFKKDGQVYFRWVINPEDTKWHLKVKSFLLQNGLDATPKTFLEGRLTASRSLIVNAPGSTYAFSLKTSTDVTGGNWTDKKQYFHDSFFIRNMSAFAQKQLQHGNSDHLLLLEESLAVGIRSLEMGVVVRDLGPLNRSNKYLMPGFAALYEKTGAEIAQKNGSSNPADYWQKNYVEVVGRAAAEFMASTGLTYNSPHSQNFVIELDEHMRPTGRIGFRDFGDSYTQEPFLRPCKDPIF